MVVKDKEKDTLMKKEKQLYLLAEAEVKLKKEAKKQEDKDKLASEKHEYIKETEDSDVCKCGKALADEIHTIEKEEVTVTVKIADTDVVIKTLEEAKITIEKLVTENIELKAKIDSDVFKKAEKLAEEYKLKIEALQSIRKYIVKSDSHIGNALKALKALTELTEKGGEKK